MDKIPEIENEEINEKPKSKKFVFMIYSDNIAPIESLTYDEKNILVNELLTDYFKEKNISTLSRLKLENAQNQLKKVILTIIAIPLIFALISGSIYLTKKSYIDMQRKFEKLFDSHEIPYK
ncbi:MAG: hypothetical protein WCK67_09760 [bacterium]